LNKQDALSHAEAELSEVEKSVRNSIKINREVILMNNSEYASLQGEIDKLNV